MSEGRTYLAHARALLVLGLPIVGSNLAQMALHVTDTVMVGWYGVVPLAAVVLGASSFFIVFVVGSGFAKAVIAPTPMGAGYHLHLVKFGRNAETEVLERQRGGWRVFKTIDAGVNTAHTIGFRRIEVDLSSR